MAKAPIRSATETVTPAAGLRRTKVATSSKSVRVKLAAELSELLSVSRGTVTKWIRDGMPVENPEPPPGKPYLIDVAIAVRWLQEKAANEARDEEGGSMGSASADGGETYEDAKTRKERAPADAAESNAVIQAIVEAEKRVWAPNGNKIVAGIELDKLRRRVAYWLTPYHPADSLTRNLDGDTNLPQPVPAAAVIHIGNPERLAGQRSESSLVTAIEKSINLGIYEGAEQVRKNVSTLFAGFFRRLPEDGATPLPQEEDAHDQTSAMLR